MFLSMTYILFGILVVVIALIFGLGITVVPKDMVYIIERMGVYYATWEAGIYFRLIGVERIRDKILKNHQTFEESFIINNEISPIKFDLLLTYSINNSLNFSYRKSDIFANLTKFCLDYLIENYQSLNETIFLKSLQQNKDLNDLTFISLQLLKK